MFIISTLIGLRLANRNFDIRGCIPVCDFIQVFCVLLLRQVCVCFHCWLQAAPTGCICLLDQIVYMCSLASNSLNSFF